MINLSCVRRKVYGVSSCFPEELDKKLHGLTCVCIEVRLVQVKAVNVSLRNWAYSVEKVSVWGQVNWRAVENLIRQCMLIALP